MQSHAVNARKYSALSAYLNFIKENASKTRSIFSRITYTTGSVKTAKILLKEVKDATTWLADVGTNFAIIVEVVGIIVMFVI